MTPSPRGPADRLNATSDTPCAYASAVDKSKFCSQVDSQRRFQYALDIRPACAARYSRSPLFSLFYGLPQPPISTIPWPVRGMPLAMGATLNCVLSPMFPNNCVLRPHTWSDCCRWLWHADLVRCIYLSILLASRVSVFSSC
jgi:hypothetical protein